MTKSDPHGISFLTSPMPVPYYKLRPTGSRSSGEFMIFRRRWKSVYNTCESQTYNLRSEAQGFTVAVLEVKVTLEKFRLERNLNPEPMRYWSSALLVDLS